MISLEHTRMFAAYNHWQNNSLYHAADGLTDAARLADRGAFFSSIHETLAHILWADRMWLSRFDMCEKPTVKGNQALAMFPEWDRLKTERQAMDALITRWTGELTTLRLAGELTWYSGAAGAQQTQPVWFIVTHIFNHQTHHRGQVHAMLTAAGAKPEDTDMFLIPAGLGFP